MIQKYSKKMQQPLAKPIINLNDKEILHEDTTSIDMPIRYLNDKEILQ